MIVDVDLGPRDRYEELLRSAHTASDETALQAAYDFGREVLTAGGGVLDLAAIHRQVLTRLVAERQGDPVRFVDRAMRLFFESLVPFEMTHRGYRDANIALRASEERYRDLFENANDIVFTTDLDGNFTSVNRAGERLTGFTHEEAMALNIGALVSPEDRRLLLGLRELRRGQATDQRARHEIDIVARDGRHIPLEVTTRIVYENDRPVGIQGIARDVTYRKQAESALRHLNQRLEEKAQRIAHALHDEAGQLLASVYLCVAELSSELPRDHQGRLEELRTLLDQVDDQLRRLAHELRPTILDDLGLLRACEFLAEGVSKRAGIRVDVRGSTGGRLPGDVETALYRLMQEALTNATKHGKSTHITVTLERTPRSLTGVVNDNGIGFDVPAVLARADTRGLGLIGMRERLVALGGKFSISSRPNHGTQIQFDVPLEA